MATTVGYLVSLEVDVNGVKTSHILAATAVLSRATNLKDAIDNRLSGNKFRLDRQDCIDRILEEFSSRINWTPPDITIPDDVDNMYTLITEIPVI